MGNVYDVLFRTPKLHKKLRAPQEKLARAIVASGRMRLDADDEANFTRLLLPEERVNLTFSLREMTDTALLKRSRKRLLEILTQRHDDKAAQQLTDTYLEKVNADLKKRQPVHPKVELMMARALVMCNELPVITLIHLEQAEIFISYGHSVSDVMDIAAWQEVGESNGMQAFGQGQNAIYVSCGGHPFLEGDERNHAGDGFPAIARFMIIAGQETGHNADMIRDGNGRWAGRHSATDWDRAPSPKAGAGRQADIARCDACYARCRRLGIGRIVEWERHLAFYHEHRLYNARRLWSWLKSRMAWRVFRLLLRCYGLQELGRLQTCLYPATLLDTCLRDMQFNLTPQADAYRSDNPQREMTVLCMEAVARVPQQVVKWGHRVVRCCTPALYALYYNDIVPNCARAVQRRKQKK